MTNHEFATLQTKVDKLVALSGEHDWLKIVGQLSRNPVVRRHPDLLTAVEKAHIELLAGTSSDESMQDIHAALLKLKPDYHDPLALQAEIERRHALLLRQQAEVAE